MDTERTEDVEDLDTEKTTSEETNAPDLTARDEPETAEKPETTIEKPETTAAAPTGDVATADVAGGDVAGGDVAGGDVVTEDVATADVAAEDVPDRVVVRPTDTAAGTSGDAAALFTTDEADKYFEDWRTVQASFVDDPQAAVGRAEALVGDVVDAVTTRISQRRADLSGQRTSTEGERTEQLRQALRGYRALLRQLLPSAGDSPNRTPDPAVRM